MKENAKIGDQDIDVYCDHLNMLREELRVHFEDILFMQIPSWVIQPFPCAENAAVDIQEELIELQTNEELKPKFKNGHVFNAEFAFTRIWMFFSALAEVVASYNSLRVIVHFRQTFCLNSVTIWL
uniref:Uncharacterized protein n=1 Tax=Trichuris muris TaxID=70415 RepID=A0A5S6QNK3_TRIMR